MTNEELRRHIAITEDSSMYYYHCGDIAEWEKASDKTVYFIEIYSDTQYDNQIDSHCITADELKTFPDGDYYSEAEQIALEYARECCGDFEK